MVTLFRSSRGLSFLAICFMSGLVIGMVLLMVQLMPRLSIETGPLETVLGVQKETIPPELPAYEVAQVEKIIDGDTIELSDGRKVRYIGIDTPEVRHPTKGVECFGKEASARNTQLVAGKTIYLEKDISEMDRYGRLLRYVWLDKDTLVNKALIAEGYAYASSYPPDIARQPELRAAQQVAQDGHQGLWGVCEPENLSL